MADRLHPTFFVVAFSARVSTKRISNARRIIESQLHRNCHILDRGQVEGLLSAHLNVISPVLRQALDDQELAEVLAYFRAMRVDAATPVVDVTLPGRVLAGVPFQVKLDIRWALATDPAARVWWRTADDVQEATLLLGPLSADQPAGASVTGTDTDPTCASVTLEIVTHAIGRVDLGHGFVGLADSGLPAAEDITAALGWVEVVETMRPRYFADPYRSSMAEIERAYLAASRVGVKSIGVIGAGGSGKSRLCEEFTQEQRRRGATVVSVRHAKTHDAPHRIFVDLLKELATDDAHAEPASADAVVRTIAAYDGDLAARAAQTINIAFGEAGSQPMRSDEMADQVLLSAVVVLMALKANGTPLIVHIQDLHRCGNEVLDLLGRLVAQVEAVARSGRADSSSRVLVILEGRVHESMDGADSWSSVPFETFLDRHELALTRVPAFNAEDARRFTRTLFEGDHNSHQLLPEELRALQRRLVEQISSSAGDNPFQILELVRLLRDTGAVERNSTTGLFYLARPEADAVALPRAWSAAIEARWRYLSGRTPRVATLIWACALVDDRIPQGLFRHLWGELAPDASLDDTDSTDILWTGDDHGRPACFRHENYFEAIRRFTVSSQQRIDVNDGRKLTPFRRLKTDPLGL